MNCKNRFFTTICELENLKRQTIEQKEFLDNYYKYMPLIMSSSPMNNLCKYIESINFDIKNKLKSNNDDNIYRYYLNNKFIFNQDIYNRIITELDNFFKISRSFWINGKNKKKQINKIKDEDYNEIITFELYSENLYYTLNNICSNVYEITNYIIRYFYEYKPSSNKDILWSMYGKYIFNNLVEENKNICYFPFPDTDGDILYLGKKYTLMEVNL